MLCNAQNRSGVYLANLIRVRGVVKLAYYARCCPLASMVLLIPIRRYPTMIIVYLPLFCKSVVYRMFDKQ